MPESNARSSFARQLSGQQSAIARCKQVLIESCDTELRVAAQFCRLAEYHLERSHYVHAQELIGAAQKAIAVAGKYARDPEERRLEVAVLSERVEQIVQRMEQQFADIDVKH